MREMLVDLPEAVAICARGCRALADKNGLEMYLVPATDPSVALLTGTLTDPGSGTRITPGAALMVDEISISESSPETYKNILYLTNDTGVTWKP